MRRKFQDVKVMESKKNSPRLRQKIPFRPPRSRYDEMEEPETHSISFYGRGRMASDQRTE